VTAAKMLVDHALARFSTDNLSCMVVRFDKHQLLENQSSTAIGVEGDASTSTSGKLTEAEKIVTATKQKIAEGAAPAVGISASNSGKGHDPVAPPTVEDGDKAGFTPTLIEGTVEEEPSSYDSAETKTEMAATKMDVDSPAKS
jgi:protein phosphatase PTC1